MVHTHARLQHEVTQVRWCSVWCKWVKYPEGVETHTPMGKPGHAESLTGTRGYQPTGVLALGQGPMVRRWCVRYLLQCRLPGGLPLWGARLLDPGLIRAFLA